MIGRFLDRPLVVAMVFLLLPSVASAGQRPSPSQSGGDVALLSAERTGSLRTSDARLAQGDLGLDLQKLHQRVTEGAVYDVFPKNSKAASAPSEKDRPRSKDHPAEPSPATGLLPAVSASSVPPAAHPTSGAPPLPPSVAVPSPAGPSVRPAESPKAAAAPAITSMPARAAATGQAYSYQVAATDPDGETLTYGLVAPVPAGMTIDPATGLIVWTPKASQVGSHAVTVRATDPSGLFGSQSFTVAVTLGPSAPTITSTPGRTATTGLAYSYQVTATDPNGDAATYSLIAAPANMTIDPTSGLISWTPAVDQTGPQAVTVRATDPGGLTGTQTFTVTVALAPLPPFPFKYAGRQRLASGRTIYFLTKDGKLYTIEVGQVLDQLYSIDGEDGGQLKVTYLPLKRQQSLQVGSPS